MQRWRLILLFWAVTAVAVAPSASCADDSTTKYFQELRQRRLFSLAEGYCLEQLARDVLADERRVEFTLELSRTFTEHARFATGDEQAELWTRAAAVIDEFLAQHPQSSARPLLQTQRVFIAATRGEILRWEAELQPESRAARTKALQVLTAAAADLREAEIELTTLLERGGRGASTAEWLTLRENVRFQLASVLLNAAQVLPAESADRAAMLIDARELLQGLAGGVADSMLTWHAQVALAEVDRLQGKYPQAEGRLVPLVQKQPPREVLDRAVAEQARLLMDQLRTADAARLLLQYRESRPSPPGELRFLNLKALIQLWEIAHQKGDSETAQGLQDQIASRLERAEREVGGYWGLRCRRLVERFQAANRYGPEVAALVEMAQTAFAENRTDDAIRDFGQAAVMAHRAGNAELAMEFGYTRASIQLDAGQYQEAADSFYELAEQFPEDARAAEAHLLYAFSLGRLLDANPNDAIRERYLQVLKSHRRRFAEDDTLTDATWMLAQFQESAGQVSEALELYREIPSSHRRGPDAQVAIARCYERILELVQDGTPSAAAWERDALARLNEIAGTFPADPREWSTAQAEVAVRLARIQLTRRSPDSVAAEQWLSRAVSAADIQRQSAEEQPQEQKQIWLGLRRTATQLRILALAGIPETGMPRARELVDNLTNSSVPYALEVLDGLRHMSDAADPETRKQLGELQLRTVSALESRRSEFDAALQLKLDRCMADAFAATNQPRRAAEKYRGLVARLPGDTSLRRSFAELLMKVGMPETWREAESQWKKLESLEKQGSLEWLALRYQRLRCLYLLEEFAACRKLLGVTQLLYPKLGDVTLRAKFQELQAALEDHGRR